MNTRTATPSESSTASPADSQPTCRSYRRSYRRPYRRSRLRLVPLLVVTALAGVAAAAPAGPAVGATRAAVPGLTIVHAASLWTSQPKSVTAHCPAPTVPIGAGYSVGGGGNEVRVSAVQPTSQGVFVAAGEDSDGYARDWSITAIAVCANPPSGWEIVSEQSRVDSTSSRGVNAYCPTGKEVTGTGGRFDGAYPTGVYSQLQLTGLIPHREYVRVVAYEDHTAPTADWWVTAYAICAYPAQLPGLQIVAPPVQITNASTKMMHAACPVGDAVLGAGAQISPYTGPVAINSMSPFSYQGSHQVTVTAGEHPSGVSRNWGLRAYAICAAL